MSTWIDELLELQRRRDASLADDDGEDYHEAQTALDIALNQALDKIVDAARERASDRLALADRAAGLLHSLRALGCVTDSEWEHIGKPWLVSYYPNATPEFINELDRVARKHAGTGAREITMEQVRAAAKDADSWAPEQCSDAALRAVAVACGAKVADAR